MSDLTFKEKQLQEAREKIHIELLSLSLNELHEVLNLIEFAKNNWRGLWLNGN